LTNLGHQLSGETVGNILGRHDIPPAPKQKHSIRWKDFIRAHLDVLARTDFFTVEVVTLKGLVTYYVLFFIHLESHEVCLAGMTPHPHEACMKKVAWTVTLEGWGFLGNCRYPLHDRDGKFCLSFDEIIESGNVTAIRLPARSPNLNYYAERWVRSAKEDCLSRLILFREPSLRRALQQCEVHYDEERNHQGKDNKLLFPRQTPPARRAQQPVQSQERLGGLLKYYYRKAA
jgi:putative transposase